MTTFPTRLLDRIVPGITPPWTRILGDNVNRLLDLDVDAIRHLWNPYTCALDDLPYLAWALSVDLWDPRWSEEKKRSVVAQSLDLHGLKGTQEGLRRHIGVADSILRRTIAPPARAFYVPALTDEGRKAFLRDLPQIRYYPFLTKRIAPKKRVFYGRLDHPSHHYKAPGIKTFQQTSAGPQLYGRKATLYDRGTEVPVSYEAFQEADSVLNEVVRISTPGRRRSFMGGKTHYGRGFYQKTVGANNLISVRLSAEAVRTYAVLNGAKAVDVRPETVYQRRPAPKGRKFYGRLSGHYKTTFAPNLIFDRITILDIARLGERQKPRSFWGHARYGIKPFSAELLVEVPMQRAKSVRGRFITGFWKKADLSKLDFTLSAIRTAKSFRDTILVDTHVHRTVSLRDVPKLGTFKLGEIRRLA